jgi:peptide/nickel transport system permease protein
MKSKADSRTSQVANTDLDGVAPTERPLGSVVDWTLVFIRTVLRSVTATLGLVLIVFFIFIAIFGPTLAPKDPIDQTLARRLEPPSLEYPLGTDRFGRDILSRLMVGARLSLVLGVAAVTIAVVSGVTVGLVTGYRGGKFDVVVMRFIDILQAFPVYIMAIAIIAVLGPSYTNTMIAVGVSTFPRFARLTRGEVLKVINFDYVEASRVVGARSSRILLRHILPNIFGPILVMATLLLGAAVLAEAGLSFLGLGPSPPAPAWGLMINDGMTVMRRAPWVALFPGLAIMVVVLGFNLLGDGLRDALDPRTRG